MLKSSGKVKAGQLWSKNKEELTKQLGELKTELSQLRIQKIVSSGSKLTKMYVDTEFRLRHDAYPKYPRLGNEDSIG